MTPASSALSRRRFLRISAATAGCAALSPLASADQPEAFAWRGTAFGNLASIELRHSDPAAYAAPWPKRRRRWRASNPS
jgi:hypothetical protein